MKHTGIPLSSLPARYQAQVAAGARPSPDNSAPTAAPSFALAPSKDEISLNKLEAAFLAKLRAEGPDWIGIKALTLKLADGCRYTPDFETLDGGAFYVWEVKGGWYRDDSRVKLLTAARAFPFFRFRLVRRKSRSAPWDVEEVGP